MSSVTSIILICSSQDRELKLIQDWLVKAGHPPMVDVRDHAGGKKGMHLRIFTLGANYLDTDAFRTFIEQLEDVDHETVHLLWARNCDHGYSRLVPGQSKTRHETDTE